MARLRLRSDEIAFFDMISDRVKFCNFFWSQMYDDWEMYPEQIAMVADNSPDKVYCSGRATSKTITLAAEVLYTVVHNPKRTGVVGAPNMVHLKPVFSELIKFIKNIEFFDNLTEKIHASPAEYELVFKNGFVLYGRIAGLTGGTNFYGIHVDHFFLDEGELFNKEATLNVQGCFNKGCKIVVAGVPNDVRDSYLWIADNDPSFSKHHVPSYANPRFDKRRRDRALRIYGGENSPMWKNHIEGRWGEPKFSSFDLRDVAKCTRADIEDRIFSISKDRYSDALVEEIVFSIPIPYGKDVYIGMDVGYYPDPSIIGVFRVEGKVGQLLARIKLIGITPEQQSYVLKRLHDELNPIAVAIDAGNIGKAIVLNLQEGKDYKNEEISKKVLPLNFGGKIVIGHRADGSEIKQWTKFFGNQLLKEAFAKQELLLPTCPEIENEIQSLVEARTKSGDFIYSGSAEHYLTALRCYTVAKYLHEHNLLNTKPKEISPSEPLWVVSSW